MRDETFRECAMMIHKPEELIIRSAAATDGGDLAEIYNYYVTETIVTFEEQVVPPTEMTRRIEEIQASSLPWLIAELGGQVVGYAYASKWKERYAYRHSAEITVYIHRTFPRRGIATELYNRLFPILRDRKIHAVIGGIALPNPASVALHEKFGLIKVAVFKEVGFKLGRWIDVGYWQRILEQM